MKAGIAFPILFIWIFLTLGFLFSVLHLIETSPSSRILGILLADSSRNLAQSQSDYKLAEKDVVSALVGGRDVRPALVDRFLEKYSSPMAGTGAEFVAAADKHGIDWRLLPAIAFQESNLGKKIPKGSYNPFGWAIYEGKSSGVYFESWASSIGAVAAKIKKDYINNGFDTPETIVAKYTSGNSPSWVFAVNFAMEEISSLEY